MWEGRCGRVSVGACVRPSLWVGEGCMAGRRTVEFKPPIQRNGMPTSPNCMIEESSSIYSS